MEIVRKVDAGKMPGMMSYVLSDDTVDRMGDVVSPAGWDLKWFKQNPIALFNHDRNFPIGSWKNVRVEGKQLIADLMPAARGTSDRVDEIVHLIDQEVLRAVSVGFMPKACEPMDPKDPMGGGMRYMRQELLEASIVAVPANPAALQLARSLNISNEIISLAFGEQATTRRRDLSTGEHAVTRSNPKVKKMATPLAKLIENAQEDLNAKRDRLVELNDAEQLDLDAIEELTRQIDLVERELAARKASEAKIGLRASAEVAVTSPAVTRRPLGFPQRDVKPSDLLVRSAVVRVLAHVSGKSIDRILDERYPGHDATAAVTKADIDVATTTASGWASQLVETATAEFLGLLPPTAIYPALRSMGVSLTFGSTSGNIKIPFSSSTTALAGGFVLEGDPIPVGRMTLDSVTLTPHKFGIIVPMTKEVMRYTNPTLESVVRDELLNRTAIKLDSLLIDATASSATRPAGLLNGVSAAGSAYGGGDYQAFLEDMKTLLGPFDTANAGRSLALLMNPRQLRNIRMMAGPNSSGFGWANQFLADFRIIASTAITAGTVIAIDTADFVTSTGDAPQFETSDQATIHMSDTPLEIVSGTGPTTADPVRSMYQTNSVALKLIIEVTWAMRRTGMIQYLTGVTW